MRCLCTLVLALAGCHQPGPPQTYRPPSPVVHVSSWGGFPAPAPTSELPAPPKEVDLLTTVRGLLESQGSRDLALAAFFLGPEPVARARQRLRLPPERISLEKLAGRLPKRELRYAREARKWAGLYGLAWPVERGWRLSSHFGPRFHPVMD